MAVPITPHLAERLDISEERAQRLLDTMLQEVRNRAASNGVQLEELGTFHEDDGTLTFVPSTSLRRRVNHQFEGLSAEDLAPPPEDAALAEEAPPLRDSTDEESEAEDDAQPSSPESPDATPATDEVPDTPEFEPLDEAGDDAQPAPEAPPPRPQDGPGESIPTVDPIEDDEEEFAPSPSSPDASEDDAPEPSPDPIEDENAEEEENAAPAWIGTAATVGSLLAVLLVVVLGWVLYSQSGLFSSSESNGSDPVATASAPSTDAPAESGSAADTGGAQADRFAGVEPGSSSADGSNTMAASGRWTIVVGSRTQRSAAENMTTPYRDQFDTVTIEPGTVNGRTWYRVTVGRYASEAAAEQALQDRAATLPGDAWTHPLQ